MVETLRRTIPVIKSPIETSAPASTPVSLAEAKDHLRITTSDHDARITQAIAAATDWAQRYTRRQFVTASYSLTFDAFPCGLDALELPRSPLVSVASVAYVDTAGNTQTLTAGDEYTVLITGVVGQIVPAYSKAWPNTRLQRDGVTVVFTSGYGAASAVPEAIRSAVLMRVADLFENPDASSVDKLSENRTAGMLLDSYVVSEAY